MGKTAVHSSKTPKIGGPYVHAVKAGGFLFTSGQIAMHPETGEVMTGDIEAETVMVLENLKGLLEDAGSSLSDVVKTTMYVKNMDQFPVINDIYSRYFPVDPPTRTRVEVSRLPRDVNVEIEFIAYIGNEPTGMK